jgi:hypothetical protein
MIGSQQRQRDQRGERCHHSNAWAEAEKHEVYGERREITTNQSILKMSPEGRDRMAQQFLEDLHAIANSAPVIDAEPTDLVEGNGPLVEDE